MQARVSTDQPAAVKPVLDCWFAPGSVTAGAKKGEFEVRAEVEGSLLRQNVLFSRSGAQWRTEFHSNLLGTNFSIRNLFGS